MYRRSTFLGHALDSYSAQSSHSAMGGKFSSGVVRMEGGSIIAGLHGNSHAEAQRRRGTCFLRASAPLRELLSSSSHAPHDNGGNCPARTYAHSYRYSPINPSTNPNTGAPNITSTATGAKIS